MNEQVKNMNTEAGEVLLTALNNLEQILPLKTTWQAGKGIADGQLTFEMQGEKHCMDVELKGEVKTNMLPRLFEQADRMQHFMVVAETIQPKAKTMLRQKDIAYLEGNGNIFLHQDATFLFIDTEKTGPKQKKQTAGFTEAEAKLLYLLLIDEKLVRLTYREIAEVTNTALGGITPLFNKLTTRGFLTKGKGAPLKNKHELLNHWVAAYQEKLQTKLTLGRFRFVEKDTFYNWRALQLTKRQTWWGGEPAADLLTNYLRPGELRLYTREDRTDLIRKYRLAPDPTGNVLLKTPFWPRQADTYDLSVPPLLVYADLIITGDHRCIETAQKIYDEVLKPILE